MKNFALFFICLVFLMIAAQAAIVLDRLVIDGQEYIDANFRRVEGENIVIIHTKGLSRIPISMLTEEQKKIFGLTPVTTNTFSAPPIFDGEIFHTQTGVISNAVLVETTSMGIKIRTTSGIHYYGYHELMGETKLKYVPDGYQYQPPPPVKRAATPTASPSASTWQNEIPISTYSTQKRSSTSSSSYTPRRSSTYRVYYYGPNGGRYYINSKGNKVYE